MIQSNLQQRVLNLLVFLLILAERVVMFGEAMQRKGCYIWWMTREFNFYIF